LKDQARVLGIDDAPFSFSDGTVPIVGALVRPPTYLEAVLRSAVTVDGDDATVKVVEMVSRSRYREQVKLILVDGIAFGGFNLVDIRALSEGLGIPAATVTRDPPDPDRLRAALQKHFVDWEERWELLSREPIIAVATDHSPLHVSCAGIDMDELKAALRSCTVQGAIPEPLRMAHLIATAYVKGESYGRA